MKREKIWNLGYCSICRLFVLIPSSLSFVLAPTYSTSLHSTLRPSLTELSSSSSSSNSHKMSVNESTIHNQITSPDEVVGDPSIPMLANLQKGFPRSYSGDDPLQESGRKSLVNSSRELLERDHPSSAPLLPSLALNPTSYARHGRLSVSGTLLSIPSSLEN